MDAPTITDVYSARQRIAPYLPRTPLFAYPELSELVGAHTWVKHENHQPVGAFKVRGGVNLVAQMSPGEKPRAHRCLDGKPRSVSRLRRPSLRSVAHHLSARARQPLEAGGHPVLWSAGN
ncbi:MAG: pyridoxal-phosphate dependent enzyme [Candidatus Dormiibacterota bacterium]